MAWSWKRAHRSACWSVHNTPPHENCSASLTRQHRRSIMPSLARCHTAKITDERITKLEFRSSPPDDQSSQQGRNGGDSRVPGSVVMTKTPYNHILTRERSHE